MAKAGDTIQLDASRSKDPDGNAINFMWWQQKEIGKATLAIDDAEKAVINVHIPVDASGQSLHLVCEVSDYGTNHLKSYLRVIIQPA